MIAPGLVAVAIFFQGIAAVALPLATELGGTREIEDRVMAPLPVSMVALEKVVWSSLQSIIAAAAVLPMVLLVSAEPVSVSVASWPMLIATVLLAALVAGYLGLVIGTVVKPKQIGLIFSLVVVPVTFLGCTYYPWAQLTNIRWLQIVTLINPLVYVCEGLRIALTPGITHMPVAAVILALLALLAALAYLGTWLFIAAGDRLTRRPATGLSGWRAMVAAAHDHADQRIDDLGVQLRAGRSRLELGHGGLARHRDAV